MMDAETLAGPASQTLKPWCIGEFHQVRDRNVHCWNCWCGLPMLSCQARTCLHNAIANVKTCLLEVAIGRKCKLVLMLPKVSREGSEVSCLRNEWREVAENLPHG